MILGLYAFLLGVSIVLILLGIFRRAESGFALIGFGILFILAMILQSGNLEVESGANVTSSFTYSNGSITSSDQTISYEYNAWDDNTAHQIGFWLAISAAVGFLLMLYSIKGGIKHEE